MVAVEGKGLGGGLHISGKMLTKMFVWYLAKISKSTVREDLFHGNKGIGRQL